MSLQFLFYLGREPPAIFPKSRCPPCSSFHCSGKIAPRSIAGKTVENRWLYNAANFPMKDAVPRGEGGTRKKFARACAHDRPRGRVKKIGGERRREGRREEQDLTFFLPASRRGPRGLVESGAWRLAPNSSEAHNSARSSHLPPRARRESPRRGG